ncbi:hypothetical protein DYU11_00785 [Fibrisoma montanum]|uniref:Uncharacterized protein n=1 Tax=Fibrisoma montanum TaxID=2305895 RepID=A0A418MHJ2_9BACT|nr:hypothetical protein [Fibrisoma montanum]RIV26889.1 hypothetical protein DYU11_00785 [Fibrisoma montanum]
MKSRVIFVSLVLALGLAVEQATAATTFTDDSPAANKPATALLVNGTEKQFASYIEQRVSRFARKSDWQNYISVVTLYNQNPVAVLSLDKATRDSFNEAADRLNEQLAKRSDSGASRWLTQANYTTRMINFLWDTDRRASEPLELE